MRTTLSLDDDVLYAAKRMADARGETVGEVISQLARKGLGESSSLSSKTRNGITLFPVRDDSGVVTADQIADLLAEDE